MFLQKTVLSASQSYIWFDVILKMHVKATIVFILDSHACILQIGANEHSLIFNDKMLIKNL